MLLGRHLGRPRPAGATAVVFEVSGERERRLWLDAGRASAGLCLLTRDEARALEAVEDGALPGRSRQALLLLRKHLDGRRVSRLDRIAGERTIVLGAGSALLALRFSGPAPALTLVVDGAPLVTVGDGPEVWPLPEPHSEREWDRVEAAVLASAVESAAEAGRARGRGILAACPPLGPLLAAELDGTAGSLEALRARLSAPSPTLLVPGPIERCHDADLAAVRIAPVPLAGRGTHALHPPSWLEAAALLVRSRRRGACFERRRREAAGAVRRDVRRLEQLEVHLARDLGGLPAADALRRQGEALLAAPHSVPQPGSAEADVPDPYDPSCRLRIAVDPSLDLPANANRLFERARRIDRARGQVEARLAETRGRLSEARARESKVEAARDLAEIAIEGTRARSPGPGASREKSGGPRRYLTSRGLPIVVGRGARENHHVTFSLARPEDYWLHARDVPGAHVILRDDQGRAGADDLREAAEVAAFFSEAGGESQVDVHVTRRKHVRPARGTPGRVHVGHSETLRATPRDPEGRLRKR